MNRRNFLTGLLAAPLVAKAEVLMPVRSVIIPEPGNVLTSSEIQNLWRGRPLFVDSSIPESGDGLTISTAFKTISEAANALKEGDRIWIANGEYRETVSYVGDALA